jgi:hypothetical protein
LPFLKIQKASSLTSLECNSFKNPLGTRKFRVVKHARQATKKTCGFSLTRIHAVE